MNNKLMRAVDTNVPGRSSSDSEIGKLLKEVVSLPERTFLKRGDGSAVGIALARFTELFLSAAKERNGHKRKKNVIVSRLS